MTQVELYDATLRDGMGGGGLTLTADEKVRLVHRLDELGVQLIEAGFPASNPKEAELFALLEHEPLASATIAAFGMTRRRGIPKAAIVAPASVSCSSSEKSSASLGLDAGKPASIRCTPSSSSRCTRRTFSSAVSVRPPPPMPSRSVAS